MGSTDGQELFSTTIGPLRRVLMSYRANGQSTGVVTVEFQRAEDANRAYAQYNNRLIDGSAYGAAMALTQSARLRLRLWLTRHVRRRPRLHQSSSATRSRAARASRATATRRSARRARRRRSRTSTPRWRVRWLRVCAHTDYTRQGNAEAPMQDAPTA